MSEMSPVVESVSAVVPGAGPVAGAPAESVASDVDFGERLRAETTGCRLSIFALSSRRTMPTQALDRVADTFNAERSSVGGSRQVINRKHELVKPVYHLLLKARMLVETYTVSYPEKGVRLIKLARVDWLRAEIGKIEAELQDALRALDGGWEDVKADARQRLGELYSDADYATLPSNGYGLELCFPSITPDERLAKLHPELYAAEQRRIASRFSDAVRGIEEAAARELSGLLEHLVERLKPGEDGKPKALRESTVGNLKEFADRWRAISIGSNAELDALIARIESAADGVDVASLRKSDGSARATIQSQFEALQQQVSLLVIDAPSRKMELD